jgi:tripartite-type tricarboxylate transporter receptor subunit TctC
MKLARRAFLQLAAGATALSAMPCIARAQVYPSRPVKLVVSYAAGGPTDILARLIAQSLSERLGQQFVVENRPGASGNIGPEAVIRSAPDGYTLLMSDNAPTVNTTLYDKLNFDFVRDIVAVAGVALQPQMMLVHPSVPAKTVPEFIAYAKANSGKVNMASSGIGGSPHMAGELFRFMAGINMLHVPYRGTGAAYADLLAGRMQVAFFGPVSAMEHVRSGTLRALAVTGTKRLDSLPNIPAVAEFLPGYEAYSWFGVAAPKGTADEIVVKLNREINVALADPTINSRITELGATTLPGSSADFGKLVVDEIEKWRKVIRAANIKPE